MNCRVRNNPGLRSEPSLQCLHLQSVDRQQTDWPGILYYPSYCSCLLYTSSVQRYIRLTELIPELLDLVDNKKLQFTVAVDISYIDKEVQEWIYEYISDTGFIKPKQIAALRNQLNDGPINQIQMLSIFNNCVMAKMCIRDRRCSELLYLCQELFRPSYKFLCKHDHVPVSYTHLDVYKRQVKAILSYHPKKKNVWKKRCIKKNMI